MATKKPETYTQKEIGGMLTNAVVFSFGSSGMAGITEGRKRQLHAYLNAAMDIFAQHVREEVITPEELVFVLAGGALYCHGALVMKTGKMALYEDIAKRMLESEEPPK